MNDKKVMMVREVQRSMSPLERVIWKMEATVRLAVVVPTCQSCIVYFHTREDHLVRTAIESNPLVCEIVYTKQPDPEMAIAVYIRW